MAEESFPMKINNLKIIYFMKKKYNFHKIEVLEEYLEEK